MEKIVSFEQAPLCTTCHCDLGKKKRHILFEDKRYCMECTEEIIKSRNTSEENPLYMEACENMNYKG